MFRVRFALLLVALLIAPLAFCAEESIVVNPPATTAPRSIDVIVTDNHGNHIAGLARSDFQILEDGKPCDITKFAALSTGSDGSDLQPPRSILLIFDETSISLNARHATVASLRSFVDHRVRPIDRVMVMTIAGVGGVFPVTSWTSNKQEILQALDKAEQSTVGNKGYERRETERNIDQTITFAQQSEANNNGQPVPITFDTIMNHGRQYASLMQQEARAAAGAVYESMTYLGSGPGKKVVVIAGGGLSTRPGADLFQYIESLRSQAVMGNLGKSLARGAQQSNPLSETSRFEITDTVREIARNAHNRGIIVYAIDPDTNGTSTTEVERTSTRDTGEEFVGVADRLSGYQLLSSVTGGLTLTGRGDMPVAQISSDLDNHYVIGYTQSLNDKGQLPKTDVKVTKPGYGVRFAFTGGPETKDSEIQDAVIANHAIGAVWSNDLQISLLKDQPLPDADGRRVKLRVLIPVKSLQLEKDGNDVIGGFAVYISTGDGQGHTSPVNRQAHDIRWPADKLPEMEDKTIGFNVDVVMKPGRNQISVGVLDRRSKHMGFAKTTL
jgi:VWFA-related protein